MDSVTSRLLEGMLEDIRMSLTTIAHAGQMLGENGHATHVLATETAQSLQLLDSFSMAAQHKFGQQQLELEPVALGAVAQGAIQELWPFAEASGVSLELSIDGSFSPVMAHAAGLQLAVQHMGKALLEQAHEGDHLVVGVHRTPGGIATGVFTEQEVIGLSARSLRRGIAVIGQAKTPFASFTARAGSGLFVADSLLKSMHTKLRIGHHQRGWGFATTMQASSQLALL